MATKQQKAGALIKAPESRQVTMPERVCMEVSSRQCGERIGIRS